MTQERRNLFGYSKVAVAEQLEAIYLAVSLFSSMIGIITICGLVHAATFLALVIMNKTNLAPLSQTTFFVVWLLSSLLTAVVSARWEYVALTLIGVTGGSVFIAQDIWFE